MADERDKFLKQRRKETEESNKAANKRMEDTQPTPTQDEVDRAKLGVQDLEELDSKEDDGGEAETRSQVADTPGSYSTRTASPATPKK